MKIAPRLKAYSPSRAVWLFAGVLLLRLFVLARLTVSPLLLPTRGDMHFYSDWALRILRGEAGAQLAFYGLPGYPYLLALLYRVFGYSPFIPGVLQAVLEAGTAVLIYRLTLLLWRDNPNAPAASGRQREIVALGAAAGWALLVPAQAYAAILMPTVWLIFVFWFVVWRLIRTDSGPGLTEYLLLGLLIGLTATGVATILFLTPLVLAACVWRRTSNTATARHCPVLAAALVLSGIVAGTSPCWIHNYFVARDPVALSAHSGINFWIGNNPEANGYPRFPPGLRAGQSAMLEDSVARAEEAAGHPLKRAEVSAFWSAKARDYIRAHPFNWLRLLLLKLRNFWSAFQYDDLSIVTNLREQNIVLPGLYFGLVAALGIPGMWLAWRRAPLSRWITAAIFLHMLSLMTVFVTERYRLPIVPGLLVLAAFGLFLFWQNLTSGQYRQTVPYLAVLAVSVLFISWPQHNPSLWALDAYNSGWQFLESGNLDAAERKLQLARAYVPANPETNFALGNVRLAQHNNRDAAQFYRVTLQFDPTHRGALNNLGVVAMEDRDYAAAEDWFRRALDLDPNNAKRHFMLGRALLELKQPEAAEREVERAIELDPNQAEYGAWRDQLKNAPRP